VTMGTDFSPPPGSVEGWSGGYRSHDIVKEIVVAFVAVLALTVILAVLFGSPRRAAITFQQWANDDPVGFLATTVDELAGTSGTATYGPPYNDTAEAAQAFFGISPQRLVGVRVPVDTAEDMVLRPLGRLSGSSEALAVALVGYRGADAAQRSSWMDAYRRGLQGAQVDGAAVVLPPGDYGPVAVMMSEMLGAAQTGAVDAALIDDTAEPGFFVFDYTRSELYLSDGDYFAGIGDAAGLAGDEWGMVNTLGNWPGQPWLLPVSFWYQIPPGSTSGNGDILVLAIVALFGVALVFLPFIPGLRVLPLKLRVYRLIWRHHYRQTDAT
jgi:hypothetical protein